MKYLINYLIEKINSCFLYKQFLDLCCYKGDRLGQCKDNVRNFLKENPEMSDDIEVQIRTQLLPDVRVFPKLGFAWE